MMSSTPTTTLMASMTSAVEIKGTRIFFKIDYYDLDYAFASPDASDENLTRRVMTIMLAEEY